MEKLKMQNNNLSNNIEKIKEIFPNVVVTTSEGEQVDFEALKQEFSDVILSDNKEKFQLTWPGKRESIVIANTPTNKTLRPLYDKSVDFENTSNIYIEGDNIDVLKILQESYLNKIKCIYIDPPYNRGSDLIYKDNYHGSASAELINSGQKDEDGNRLVTNTDTNGKFHSDWLSIMYSRLKLARNLLTKDGVIFISIDDNELYNLKKLCDEIFGENSFVNCIVVKSSEPTGVKMAHAEKKLPKLKEYILMYKKSENLSLKYNDILIPIETWGVNYKNVLLGADKQQLEQIRELMNQDTVDDNDVKKFDELVKDLRMVSFDEAEPNWKSMSEEERLSWKYDNAYRIVREVASSSAKPLADAKSDVCDDNFFGIKTSQGKLYFIKNHYNRQTPDPNIKLLFACDYLMVNPCDLWVDIKTTRLDQEGMVSYNNGKKPLKLINRVLSLVTNENDIILDFFSGSGTTGHSVLDLNSKDLKNRKFILVQINENLDESLNVAVGDNKKTIKEAIDFLDSIGEEHILSRLGIERLKRSAKKIKEDTNANIDYGFRVFKVDSSNMKDVYYKPSDMSQMNLLDYLSNIKEDRTPEDLLTQVMLDLGLTLDLKIDKKNILNNKVFYVENNSLVACFDEQIDINIIDEICKSEPLKVVFKDVSFKTDKDKINLEEKIKKLSPDTEVSII